MDAVEFLKEWKRMCESTLYGDCPVNKYCRCCVDSEISILESESEKIVNIIEQWSKEHPRKTRLQDFLEKYPNAKLSADGAPFACVGDLGYCVRDFSANCLSDYDCVECWNQPFED